MSGNVEETRQRSHISAGCFSSTLATNPLGEAEPLCRRALAIVEASLGPDHPSTVTVRRNLAALLGRDP